MGGYLGLALAVTNQRTQAISVQMMMVLVASFPIILIWTNAVLILLRRWQRHPQVSKYALLGLFGFLLKWIEGVGYGIWFSQFAASSLSPQAVQFAHYSHYCVGVLLTAGSALLVLAALVGWRDGIQDEIAEPDSA